MSQNIDFNLSQFYTVGAEKTTTATTASETKTKPNNTAESPVVEEKDSKVALSSTKSTTSSSSSNSANLEKKVQELKSKYYVAPGSGDKYSANNPQLLSFNQAMKDGIIESLTREGYSSSDIIEIINQVFPDIGIRNNPDGGYTLPLGHGDEAKGIYDSFKDKISAAGGSSEKTEMLKAEIAQIQTQINYNISKLEQLETQIEALKNTIEQEIDEALQESEELTETQKRDTQKIVSEELNRYTGAKGKMSYEEFQSSLNSRLNALDSTGSSKLATITSKIFQAQSKMPILNNYLETMDSYIKQNDSLSTKLTQKNDELAEAQKEAAKNTDVKRCDPIGFFSDGTRYDFFVDKDNNNSLSNEKEFLGANNGWKEMMALDTNKDGLVSGKELKESNIKLVVTNPDGSQIVKNAADVFKDTDYVDLSSYKEKNQTMGNGNTLLGLFSLNKDGKQIKDAYNTLDNLDWLDANYNFSDKDEGKNRFAQNQTVQAVQTTKDYSKDLDTYREEYTNLSKKLDEAINKMGFDKESLSDIKLLIEQQGISEAEGLNKKFEELKLKEENS